MKLARAVSMGARILVGLNLLMALGSIWVFTRMAPAIEMIISRNEHSLQACEEMLAALVLLGSSEAGESERYRAEFTAALHRAQGNITEKEEPAAIALIVNYFPGAFDGEAADRRGTVDAIVRLAAINRKAMVLADREARAFGNAGAWGVVFMASCIFLAGMLFLRILKRNLVRPFEEIHLVMTAALSGDTMRRCAGHDVPKEVRAVYHDINKVLDRS